VGVHPGWGLDLGDFVKGLHIIAHTKQHSNATIYSATRLSLESKKPLAFWISGLILGCGGMLQSRTYNHRTCLIPPSPTTTNGAHRAGFALRTGPASIMAIMACRWASARVRPVLAVASIRVVRVTAASETTGQCETSRARPWRAISSPDPGQDRALASNPEEPDLAGKLLSTRRSRKPHRGIRRSLQQPPLPREPQQRHARRCLIRARHSHHRKESQNQKPHYPETTLVPSTTRGLTSTIDEPDHPIQNLLKRPKSFDD